MTTTRHSITRQDHPEAFASYHALPDTITQHHGRYGPSNHISLPRFSDPHNPILMNQGSVNDISFNRPSQVPHMSGQSYHFNFGPSNGISRPPFTPLGSPGIWSSAHPPIRQAAPLPPAQGYGMGQDLTGGSGQAKRRRINEDTTPSSSSTSPSSSPAAASRMSRGDVGNTQHLNHKGESFLLTSHTDQRLHHTLAREHEQSEVSESFNSALSDPLLGDPSSEGVGEWAGVGDFALFNDLQSEVHTDTGNHSEWNSTFMSFTDEEAGSVAASNNLFDLKEDTLFPTIDRTNSAPAATDLSLGSFEVKSPHPGDHPRSSSGLHCTENMIPAVATGRPLMEGTSDMSYELPLGHSNFTDSYAHDDRDLSQLSAADTSAPFDLSGSLSDLPSNVEDDRSGHCNAGPMSSSSLVHMSKLTEAEVGGGSSSDASTAASVSDFSAVLMPMSKSMTVGSSSVGGTDVKSTGKPSTTYPRSTPHVSRYGWRSVEGPSQDSASSGGGAVSNEHAHRPDLSLQTLEELNDISCFKNDERYKKLIVDYTEGISFPLGEGGRELLRACLNVKGCKGRQLQGASVPALLALAKTWGLWDVAIRIKVERSCGQLCPQHDAFVKFKANQSQMRKYVKKEYMVTERDNQGCLSGIIYDERRKITLGKEGRESLRTQLRRLHDKHAGKMDDLLEKHGFKYSELRNATVQQLSRMAYVCNLWDKVVAACRKQEEKRDYRNRDGSRSTARSVRDYTTTPSHDHLSYVPTLPQELDPNHQGPGGLGDAWKTAYPADLQSYGDLPANAYETDDGGLGVGMRQDDGDPNGCPVGVADYQSHFSDVHSLVGGDSKTNEVRVKREQPEESTNESGKRVQKPALSIEDLLSTLTVNWESPTSESIERFLQRQQEGHDTPVTEDNIFQAFSDLVPMMNGGEGHSNHWGERPQESNTGMDIGLDGRSGVCNSTTLMPSAPGDLHGELYDHAQQNLFSLNEML